MRADELDDELAQEYPVLAALAQKSPALQQLLSDLAGHDIAWDQEQAAPKFPVETTAEPAHPRARKRAQRRRLFAALRDGRSREAACELAGVPLSLFDQWCLRPRFRESVEWAEDRSIQAIDNPLR